MKKNSRWTELQAGIQCPLCAPREDVNEFWYFVQRLPVSSLYLSREHQAYRGACLLIYDPRHAVRIDELSAKEWAAFSADLRRAELGMVRALKPAHMNVASLGNIIPHLHWHLVPRYENDARWGAPVWTTSRDEMAVARLEESEYAALADEIKGQVARVV